MTLFNLLIKGSFADEQMKINYLINIFYNYEQKTTYQKKDRPVQNCYAKGNLHSLLEV